MGITMSDDTSKVLLVSFQTLISETRKTNDGIGKTNVAIEKLRGDIRLLNSEKADKEKVDKKFEDCQKAHEDASAKTIKIGPDTRAWLTRILVGGAMLGGGFSLQKIISFLGLGG